VRRRPLPRALAISSALLWLAVLALVLVMLWLHR